MSELTMPQAVELGLELLGKDGGVVVGEASESANLRWANSQLTTNGNTNENSLNIVAFVPVDGGIGAGIASGQVRNRDDVAKLVEVARASGVASGASVDAAELFAGAISADFNDAPASADLSGISHIASGLSLIHI